MGLLKCPRSSWASKLDAHPLSSFVELSYIYSSSASVAWQSLLLALTSIGGHLHSPLISLIDVRLSPFCLLHITPSLFYSTHSAISMAHAHVLRESWEKFEIAKVWNNCLACHRGCAWWEHSCVTKMDMTKLYDFVGTNFLLPCYFEKTWLLLLVCLKYYYFFCQYELLFWIIWIWKFMTQ